MSSSFGSETQYRLSLVMRVSLITIVGQPMSRKAIIGRANLEKEGPNISIGATRWGTVKGGATHKLLVL